MISQTMNFLAVVLCLWLSTGPANGRPHCEMTEKYADDCGKKLIFIGEHTTRLPATDEEMMKSCGSIDEGLQCLKKYSKSCLDPFATQIMNIVVKNGDKMEQKYCKDDSGRKTLLGHFACSSPTQERLDKLHLCMDKWIVQMEHLSNVSGDHRIPATCCSFLVMDKCVKDTLTQICDKPDSVAYINTFLTEMTGEIVKVGCGKFDNLGHCNANMDKKEWDLLKNLVQSDDPTVINAKRLFGSPFIALKNVMKQLMEE